MAIPHSQAISSPEAIADSIRSDRHVFRWFLHLITQPSITKKLAAFEDITHRYKEVKGITSREMILWGVFLLCFYSFVVMKSPYVLLALLIIIYLMNKLHHQKREKIVPISLKLLLSDCPQEELVQKTLYEISEIYSQKLEIPSLVDTIYVMDRALRRTILWTFVFTCFIYPLNFWEAFIWLWVTFLTVRVMTNINYFYQKLR